jgi:hypothetical protein
MPDSTLQEFKGLPKDLHDAVALVQKQLNQSLASLDTRAKALGREGIHRRRVAILLKVVSVLSGIVIATGFLQHSIVQVLGGIVPAVAALERVFANLSRLLAVSAAKNAYERIRRQTVARHDREIITVIKVRDRDTEKAANSLISFVGKLRDRLAAAEEEIEDKLAKNDYDSLGRLALDEDTQQP